MGPHAQMRTDESDPAAGPLLLTVFSFTSDPLKTAVPGVFKNCIKPARDCGLADTFLQLSTKLAREFLLRFVGRPFARENNLTDGRVNLGIQTWPAAA